MGLGYANSSTLVSTSAKQSLLNWSNIPWDFKRFKIVDTAPGSTPLVSKAIAMCVLGQNYDTGFIEITWIRPGDSLELTIIFCAKPCGALRTCRLLDPDAVLVVVLTLEVNDVQSSTQLCVSTYQKSIYVGKRSYE